MISDNPFLWTGPAFLGFYLALAVLTSLCLRGWLHARNRPSGDPRAMSPLADPYAVAYLRGGPTEAVRAAVFTLVHRGLLVADGPNLKRSSDASGFGLKPFEQDVLSRFATPRSTEGLMWETAWGLHATDPYRQALTEAGFLDRTGATERRVVRFAVVALLAVAGIKIAYALLHGHHNIGFLIGLALLSWIFLAPRRRVLTSLGRRVLAQQEVLFRGLRRGKRTLAEDDATWVAAVFGVAALSTALYPAAAHVMPPRPVATGTSSDSGSSSSSSSSSCSSSSDSGSSSSDSGGSGCGGCGGGGGGGD